MVKKQKALTYEEIQQQSAAARAKHAEDEKAGLVALSARYDRATRRILIEMSNGLLFGVPVSRVASLKGATPAELATVEVDELGSGLHWESLDADVSVLGIIFKQLNYPALQRAAAVAGGRAKSDAKVSAARENGKRGGRPWGTSKWTVHWSPGAYDGEIGRAADHGANAFN